MKISLIVIDFRPHARHASDAMRLESLAARAAKAANPAARRAAYFKMNMARHHMEGRSERDRAVEELRQQLQEDDDR